MAERPEAPRVPADEADEEIARIVAEVVDEHYHKWAPLFPRDSVLYDPDLRQRLIWNLIKILRGAFEPGAPAEAIRREAAGFLLASVTMARVGKIPEATGRTVSDVVRHALALELWWERNKREQNRVLVEKADGRIREVVGV